MAKWWLLCPGFNVLTPTTMCSPVLYKARIFVWAICPGLHRSVHPWHSWFQTGPHNRHTKEVYKSSAYSLLGQQFNQASLPYSRTLNTSNTIHRPLYFLPVTGYDYLNICDFVKTSNTIWKQTYFPHLLGMVWLLKHVMISYIPCY